MQPIFGKNRNQVGNPRLANLMTKSECTHNPLLVKWRFFGVNQGGRPCLGWCSIRKVSSGQIRTRILQLCELFTVPQLTLHAGVATFVLRVLFCRALAPILIARSVPECFLPTLNFDTLDALMDAGADSRD